MDELFLKRMALYNNSTARKVFVDSNTIMDATFDRDVNFKRGALYDVNGTFLENVDFKYQYHAAYTISKDNVEFYAQFRPYYHPDVKYKAADGALRLGFYLDVPNDLDTVEKWLICGRNDTITFTRYNILKCNWTFNWIVDGTIYQCLGCLRNRNNYNSGIWSNGFTTTVENESQMILPSNAATQTIDYDMRFMISDNRVHPKVYSVSKIEDTFPLGVVKITLVQAHFDAALDNVDLQVCNYYDSKVSPEAPGTHVSKNAKLSCTGKDKVLHRGGSARTVSAVITQGDAVLDVVPDWHFILNGVEKTVAQLTGYTIAFSLDQKSFAIKVAFEVPNGDVLKVEVGSKTGEYYDSIEMEVKA